jgi:hypothetical protein
MAKNEGIFCVVSCRPNSKQITMPKLPCGDARCRAYKLTIYEFALLGGEPLTQGFRVRLGHRAAQLSREIYGREPRKVRDNIWAGHRNIVRKYPCGILEQAYRELKSETAAVAEAAE